MLKMSLNFNFIKLNDQDACILESDTLSIKRERVMAINFSELQILQLKWRKKSSYNLPWYLINNFNTVIKGKARPLPCCH